MEGLKAVFPVPVYINQVDIKDIKLPEFEDDIHVVQKERKKKTLQRKFKQT